MSTATASATVDEPLPPAPAAPKPTGRILRWGQAAFAGLLLLRHAPFTVGFVLLLWIVGAATGSLGHGPDAALLDKVGVGWHAVAAGHWWTPLSSILWCTDLSSYLWTTALFALLVTPVELRLGARRTAALLVACQIGGALLGIAIIRLGVAVDDPWLEAYELSLAVGPSIGAAGASLAGSARLSALWRRRLRLTVLSALVLLTMYIGLELDVLRLCGGLVGLAVGVALLGRRSGRVPRASSHSETRVLVALLTAILAVGPLLSHFSSLSAGPLSNFSSLTVADSPDPGDIAQACGFDPHATACLDIRAQALFGSFPGVIMLFIPALLLLVLADGLRRGRKLAWYLSLAVNILMIIATIAELRQIFQVVGGAGAGSDLHYQLWFATVESLIFPVLVVLVLLVTRRHFEVPSARGAITRLGLVVGLALAALCAVYLGLGYLVRDEFEPTASFARLLADLPKRLLPPSYTDLFHSRFVPVGGAAQALYRFSALVFWLVTIGGLFVVFRRTTTGGDAKVAAKARGILIRGGGSTLSYMTTWPGNTYWISPDERAAVAYRVISGIALTTGDPVGAPAARQAAVGGFTAFCDRNGWSPCFYSVTAEGRDAADALGWRSVQVAEDTVLPLPELSFTGKKWQDVRTSLNKAGKVGITAQWWTFADAPIAVVEQIRAISEEWVADKGLPEMGFTLGGLDELDDPAVRCLIAIDEHQSVHGVTSWMPVYRDGAPIGWTLDFMRRRADGFRGVMEFLIASAALSFKDEGAQFLSLSGAPMARVDRGEQPVPLQRLLDVAGEALEPVYGFRSLLAFKAKFQPTYQPLYMVYPDPAALPSIGNAIGKAYLPHSTPRQTIALLRRLTRR